MEGGGGILITVAETETFTRDASAVFEPEEYEELVVHLAGRPTVGDLIPNTGGVRKVRWRARGQGKRGGARVIYYFYDGATPLYLLAVYAKGEKIDLTADEKREMRRLTSAIADAARSQRGRRSSQADA